MAPPLWLPITNLNPSIDGSNYHFYFLMIKRNTQWNKNFLYRNIQTKEIIFKYFDVKKLLNFLLCDLNHRDKIRDFFSWTVFRKR